MIQRDVKSIGILGKFLAKKKNAEWTNSGYDYCDTHAKKHRSKEHYHRKKLAKMASTQILVGNLEVNKNDTT